MGLSTSSWFILEPKMTEEFKRIPWSFKRAANGRGIQIRLHSTGPDGYRVYYIDSKSKHETSIYVQTTATNVVFMLFGPDCWDRPYQDEPISPEDRKMILGDFTAGLKVFGVELREQKGPSGR
jgi:hypothetical protein